MLPAFSQRQKAVAITLARGRILDRHGVPLHYPVWGNALVEIRSSTDEAPAKVKRSLTAAEITAVLAKGNSSVAVVPEEIRYGPSSLACHVVGHVRPNAYNDPRDNVGESGLEKAFQSTLAGGSPAWSGVVVTAEGDDLPGTGMRIAPPAENPHDLYTTLDARVQQAVEEVLDERGIGRGAVVVLDALTSEVLAMASRPEFDQNHPELSLHAEGSPFVNRALSAFAPGSVFKPVIAALALERGYVDSAEVFTCTGEVLLGNRTIACGSAEGGHGPVTVKEALSLSCNSTLIQIGMRIPAQAMVDFIKTCGFGRKTGVPLQDEVAGALPDPWEMYAGDVANLCIGQGPLSVTPLQVASFFAALSADGVYRQPRLLPEQGKGDQARLMSSATAATIMEALVMAARGGTGKAAWIPLYGSAGKTGTAETGYGPGVSHAWFCGFTPVIAPRYVIVVMVEEGGDGPSVAAPVFREIGERLLDTHAPAIP
ncbi:MAG: peptidoglycan D,D-transpeptidase FtsI family protein [Bacillota bacterium]